MGCTIKQAIKKSETEETQGRISLPKALLLNRNKSERDDHFKPDNEPAYTVCSKGSNGRQRALLISGAGNTNFAEAKPGKGCRYPDEPATTVTTVTKNGGELPKAFVVGSQYAQPGHVKDCQPQTWSAAEPYFTVTVSSGTHNDQRAYIGKVVKMTPRALARLQSIPDNYSLPDASGLACEIIGNAVPCLLAKAICASLN